MGKIKFERDANVTGFLSQKEICKFELEMKKGVVLIECHEGGITGPLKEQGGGFTLEKRGYIMTVDHVLIRQKNVSVHVKLFGEENFLEATVIYRNTGHDIAILQLNDCESLKEWDYVEISEDNLQAGIQVSSICHPSGLPFTFVTGDVVYPVIDLKNHGPAITRRISDIRRDIDKSFESYNANLPLIQISNFHGSGGSSGAPVFSNSSCIVGMLTCVSMSYDFAIPGYTLNQHINLCSPKQEG